MVLGCAPSCQIQIWLQQLSSPCTIIAMFDTEGGVSSTEVVFETAQATKKLTAHIFYNWHQLKTSFKTPMFLQSENG